MRRGFLPRPQSIPACRSSWREAATAVMAPSLRTEQSASVREVRVSSVFQQLRFSRALRRVASYDRHDSRSRQRCALRDDTVR